MDRNHFKVSDINDLIGMVDFMFIARENKKEETPKEISNAFAASVSNISCIYLFTLGTVKELRHVMNISNYYGDDHMVCKYGSTLNLAKTVRDNKNAKLTFYSLIDPICIPDAESNMNKLLNAGLVFEGYDNIAIIDHGTINDVRSFYEKFNSLYYRVGKLAVAETDLKMMNKDHEINIMKKEIEKLNCMIELLKLKLSNR